MIHNTLIKKAIRFSLKTHEVYQKQKRKGKDIPYITHPLTVGLILARAGADEEVIAAGILHDTIEDSPEDKKVTKEMLAERFGERVARLVDDVTEHDRSRPWEERKREAIAHIATFPEDSLLVKAGDVIANASEILEDHGDVGDAVFKRFSKPKELIVAHYRAAAKALLKRLRKSPLADDLEFVYEVLARI